jgi:3,4-dihydroxy 2-butanone 4-phosphate synthase
MWHKRACHDACVRRAPCAPPAVATLQPCLWETRHTAPRARHIVALASKESVYAQQLGSLNTPSEGFDSIGEALQDLAAGKFVVVLDDEDRENEGDLIINADKVTTADMAFMVEHTSGVICIGMHGEDLDRLRLPLMVDSRANNESMYTAFTVTVDLEEGTTTGISAADRAATLRALADPSRHPSDFRRPGHIFPLRARPGGVLVRPGHTEAAVDLATLSGSYPAGAAAPPGLSVCAVQGCIRACCVLSWQLVRPPPSCPPTAAAALPGPSHT